MVSFSNQRFTLKDLLWCVGLRARSLQKGTLIVSASVALWRCVYVCICACASAWACSVPVQRFLRYPLLLQEMIKALPVADPRRALMLAATQSVQDVAKHINECKRDADNIMLIDKILANMKDYLVGEAGCVPLVHHSAHSGRPG